MMFHTAEPESPQDLIEGYKNNQVDGETLLNSIMRYDGWRVLTQSEPPDNERLRQQVEDGTYITPETDEQWDKCFSIFSSPATLLAADRLPDEIAMVEGHQIFRHIPEGFQKCYMDPGLASSICYPNSAFPQLRDWGNMVALDEAFESLLEEEEPDNELIRFLYNFDAYQIVLNQVDGEEKLALAPDQRERSLAAVFTASAATQAYLDWLLPKIATKEPPLPFTLNGPDLFKRLQELPLEGIVFNPCGPTPQRAFGPQLLQLMQPFEQTGQGSMP